MAQGASQWYNGLRTEADNEEDPMNIDKTTNAITQAWDALRDTPTNRPSQPEEIAQRIFSRLQFLLDNDVTQIICYDSVTYDWYGFCADTWGGDVPGDNRHEPMLKALLDTPGFDKLNRDLEAKYGTPFYTQPSGDLSKDGFPCYPWEPTREPRS